MDRTPVPNNNTDTVNRVEAYARLLTVPAVTSWTADREAVHGGDAFEYRAFLAAMEGELRSQHVPGDGRWAAGRRTRRATRGLKKMVKGSDLAAEGAREFRQEFADHVRHVNALPGQREAKAARSADRRASVGAFTAKALNKSVTAAAPAPEAPAAEQQPQQDAQVRGIHELWNRRGA